MTERMSPSLKTRSPTLTILASSSTTISVAPATQHLPMERATTAAWEVIPPRAVRIASELTIPMMSSGEVSARTRTTFLPASCWALHSSALKTMAPVPAPGEAGRPWITASCFLRSASSKVGWSKSLSCFGSTRRTASFSSMRPSSTKSQAILRAALAVLLPLRAWRKKSLPFSMVYSISCISWK